jgi:hypothetical protein
VTLLLSARVGPLMRIIALIIIASASPVGAASLAAESLQAGESARLPSIDDELASKDTVMSMALSLARQSSQGESQKD